MNKPFNIADSGIRVQPRQNEISTALFIGLLIALYFFTEEDFYSALGLGWTAFLFSFFVMKLGKSFPVLELMLLMAALQWIFGPWISYESEFQHFKYFMYVDEALYMSIVVPGVIAFSIAIFIFYPKYVFNQTYQDLQNLVYKHRKLPYHLIYIGLISTYIGPYMPAVVGFVFYLTASFQYVGLALLLFQPHSKKKWNWFIIIMGILAISSIMKGMFHDLLLWSALLFSFVIIQLRLNLFGKISFILAGFMVALVLQTIKGELRAQLGGRTSEQKIELFGDLVQERIEGDVLYQDETLTEISSVRLNQGWIISAIILNVPDYEPFAEGETILDAITSSLLPRFLVPDKKIAGGRDNFRRFTGLPIMEGTSMGTSIIGEAYGNYGTQGSWIFMFIWGAFLAIGFRYLVKYGARHPIIFAFIPLIFLQVIKAETELIVVLNHFVKSLILVFGFLWFARRFLKWQV